MPRRGRGSIPIPLDAAARHDQLMGNGLRGADLELMTGLAGRLDGGSARLQGVANGATAEVHGLANLWTGPDSAQFRQLWVQLHRPRLQQAVTVLADAAATVERNRRAQEQTSAAADAGGTPTGVGPIGGGSGSGDQGTGKFDDGARIVGWDPSTDPLFRSPGGEGSIHANDIDQWRLGDCYLVSALASLASADPDLIRDAVVDNGDGTYTVTLHEWVDGELVPVEMTVTNEMPITEYHNDETDTWEPIEGYTAGEADGELWPRIYEKAYALMLGDGDLVAGYSEIIGGDGADALEILTGVPSETTGTGRLTIEELDQMLDEGSVLPASQRHIPGSGFMGFGKDTGDHHPAPVLGRVGRRRCRNRRGPQPLGLRRIPHRADDGGVQRCLPRSRPQPPWLIRPGPTPTATDRRRSPAPVSVV